MNFSNFDSLTGENGLNHYLESQLRILEDTRIDSQEAADAAGASLDALVRVVTENSGLLTQNHSKLPEVIEFLKSTKKIKVLTKELDSPEAGQELKKVIHQATARFSDLEDPSFSLGLSKIDEKLYYRTFADWLNKHSNGDVFRYINNKTDLLGLAPYLTRVRFLAFSKN